jgi:3-oxoacyl-[acyl-carrier protein] reductase
VQRVAVVTAGCHGLGRAIAETLAQAGHRVVATSRRPDEGCRQWASGLGDRSGVEVRVEAWSPHDPDDGRRLVEQTRAAWGAVDVLVCNAGPYHRPPLSLAQTPEDIWRVMWEGNVLGSFRLVQAALPLLRAGGLGRIVTLGFVGAGQALGWAEHGPYAAAKAALASMTRTLAQEERRFGITANMVCPSDIKRTDKERIGADDAGRVFPIGGDVARLIRYLAAPEAQFVTGQIWETAFAWGTGPGQVGVGISPLSQAPPLGTRLYVPAWEEVAWLAETRLDHRGLWYRMERPSTGQSGWFVPEQTGPADA